MVTMQLVFSHRLTKKKKKKKKEKKKEKKSIIAKLADAGIQPSFTTLNLHEELHSMARVCLTSVK